MEGHVSCSIADKVADKDSQTSDKHPGAARAGLTAYRECQSASWSRTRFTSNDSDFKARWKRSKLPTDEDALDGQSDRKERRFKKPWSYCKNDDKNHSKKEKKGCLCKNCCCCCDRGKNPGCCCHCCKKTASCSRKDDREKGESDKSRERESRRRESRSRERVDRHGRGWDRDSDVDSDKSKDSFDSSDSLSDRKSTKDRHHGHSRECLRESFREGRYEHPSEFWHEPTRELHREASRESRREPLRELLREPSRESRREPIRDLLREPPRESRREPNRELLREPSRDYQRDAARESPRDPSRECRREREPLSDYRREPPREYRHEPTEHRHEPTEHRHEPTEHRHEPPRDYRREPARECRHESPREFRREPSRECRHEPSTKCRHDTCSDSRREPPTGRELSREPSHESHWDSCRERPSCEYHHSSRRSSSCHCKSSCCKCRFKSSKESESQPRRSCSGNKPSICSIRSSNCLPIAQTPSQAGQVEPSRTNSYVLIKCVPCTIQQSTTDSSHKPSNKGGSYQRPAASPQRQIQIQSLVPPTLLPPPPPLTLNRNPAAGQGLSLGPSYVPLNGSNLNRTQPALSLSAPPITAGLILPPQQTVQLPLARQLSATQTPSLGQSSPKVGGQFSPGGQLPSSGQISSGGQQPSCGQFSSSGQSASAGLFPSGQIPSGGQSSPSAQLSSGGQVGSNGQQAASSGQFSSGQLPSGGQSSSSGQFPAGGQLLSGGQCSPGVQPSLGGQYYSGNQSSSGVLYPTNTQCSQPGQSTSPGYQQASPTVQYVSSERTTPCNQYLSADQNPSFPQQQSSSLHLQSSSAVSLQQHSPYSTPHSGHRENHQHNTANSDTQSQQSYTPHPYQTLVMCTPCSPNCCSPQSPCGSRPCSSYNQFPPCGPQRACCTTHQVCEPCIPQPELRRHPHAHCRHPADFRGQPPEYRCPVSCTVRVAGCRLRTIHPYLTRPPCVVYSPSSCPCQSSKRFTDHCGAHHRTIHARHADDTVIGATHVHPDSLNNEGVSRHRHNAERTYAGHYYRTAHCRHQIVDNVMSGRNATSRKQQPSPPPMARTRAPRDTYTSAHSTTNCDPNSEVETVPVTRPSSAS